MGADVEFCSPGAIDRVHRLKSGFQVSDVIIGSMLKNDFVAYCRAKMLLADVMVTSARSPTTAVNATSTLARSRAWCSANHHASRTGIVLWCSAYESAIR